VYFRGGAVKADLKENKPHFSFEKSKKPTPQKEAPATIG
jgi:hypothetical protein